jgi:hypothetical protein
MGNRTSKRRRTLGPVIQSCAVNVEKQEAVDGKHLNIMCCLDKTLHCAVKTKGSYERHLSGAFLWYICSPTTKQLDQLSKNENWSSRFYQESKDEDGTTIVQKSSQEVEGVNLLTLICSNDITLEISDTRIWNQLTRRDKEKIEMTMNSTFDLSSSDTGLVPGTYRVDFYMTTEKIDSTKFYKQDKFPPASKTIHFEVK